LVVNKPTAYENMAVNCSWADAQVLSDTSLCSSLPPEILHIIATKNDSEYLDALAFASLRPPCTDRLFILYEPLIVEITARWLCQTASEDLATDIDVFSGLARILPLAPYLKPRLTTLLASSHLLNALKRTGELSLVALAEGKLLSVLLAWFRLLTYDVDSFAFVISPLQLSSLVAHTNLSVRRLATQCISFQMKMSDSLSERILMNHVPEVSAADVWEGKLIDYRWLKVFEEERWKRLEYDLGRTRFARPNEPYLTEKGLTGDMLSSQTAMLANILIPRSSGKPSPSAAFVHTLTTTRNLKGLAQGLLESNPILLVGKAGSGKTSLVNEAARELNKSSSMITLHLNEQTDVKSLIGLYTTSATGGGFVWQPGILTKAMEQGKWIVIEDIDSAPSEVMGTLLPIINKGVLLLPNRREQVRAADGFRVIATIRRSDDAVASGEPLPRSLLGSTRWKQILVQELPEDETAIVLREKYAFLGLCTGMALRVMNRIKREYERNPVLRNLRTEATSLRTTLKWCDRMNSRLKSFETDNIAKIIPESVQEEIFMDALDCFAGHLPTPATRFTLAECIAEEMYLGPQRRDYCFQDRTPSFHENASELKLGRANFTRLENRRHAKPHNTINQPFASTKHARKVMESMLAAIMFAEPLLLVGETGIGKTAFIQRLALAVNQKLTVINLSQQSESSDLLGGFKPITTRSLALPLFDTFYDLFEDTFSAERNQTFQSSVIKCVAKQNWRRLLLLWQEALKKAWQKVRLENGQPMASSTDKQPTKKRRLVSSRNESLSQRWADFSIKVEAFSAQLSRGDKNFAFAFVEGKLVDAVRNGEWILFDEINLASPETLESIASLLRSGDDGVPFLLLPEAGSLERVVAHPSLRIFAAMNPANDTGKKDLTPGLRSRFTEIFVSSPDDDLQDLISLVTTYLGSLADIDERAAADLARLYIQIKKLNDENRLMDGADDRPHFSIRSLVRCLMYVGQNASAYGLRRAMYEGAAMSFLTVLNKESCRIVLPILDEYILSSVRDAPSLLSQMRKAPLDGDFVTFKHHWLRRGPLAPEQRPHYIVTPFVEGNLLNLARATSMKRFPILLQGPTSSGKTSMVEHLAKVSGHHFVRINNHEHTDLQEYLGFYASNDDGKLQYKEGVLVRALREGHWLVLDELNLAPTDVLEALNRLLDDNRELLVPESQEVIRPHPNFMLFATQNPAGAYGGRKRLSKAFRNRFLEIHFDDLPEDELEIILTKRTGIAPSFCTAIVSVYKRLALLRQSARLFEQRNSFVTLRDLFRWAFRRADDRQQLANNGFMLLAERVRDPVERRAVKSTIEDVLKVKVNEISLYDKYLIPAASQFLDGIVWTPAMKRLYSLLSEAIAHDEPVLLIGETGCGKTQVCQTVASAAGRRLQIYNAHANTETGDLIGAQRPTRQKAEIERQLREDVGRLLSTTAEKGDDAGLSLDELIDTFENADLSSVDSSYVKNIHRQIAHRSSLFEWMDGKLVRAMKEGDYFLLDEISLAEDSVLERLNSLLEPQRTIFLAEKGPIDSYVVAAPGFQFMATMNPGGDYGKRELSAALRNRFTEIWVPPLTDDQDILPIIQSKLPSSARDAAKPIIDFAKWFKAFFENSITTSISLRNLLSWSDFIRATAHLTARESIVHGAAMVYIDMIGANPSGMTNVNVEAIDAVKQQCLDKLEDLLRYNASEIYYRPLSLTMGAKLRIGCFYIDAIPGSTIPNDLVLDSPTTLRNAMKLVRALQVSKPILLEGNPGAGKTALITALARMVGKSLVRINLSDQTDLMDLFGADVPTEGGTAGSFSWRDGPLLQAMQRGAWVLLDEMNLASQSVLEGLNSCLDHRQEVYISELDRTFQRHPHFALFAAQNPHHKGGGRKGLPASFTNRFTVVYTEDFKTNDLAIICRHQFPAVAPSDLENLLVSFFEVQKRVSRDRTFQNCGGPWEVNLRDITRLLQLSTRSHGDESPLQYLDVVIGRRFRTPEQRASIDELLCLQPNRFPQRALYHNLTLDSYQVGSALLTRNPAALDVSQSESLPGPKDLPTMQALMLCISQAWPGILVGPAGCDKSGLLRNVAATIGTHLVELPMNADTDTTDLIGGFDQYDAEHTLSTLRQELCQIVKNHIAQKLLERSTGRSWDLAMDLYERLVIGQEDMKSTRPVIASLAENSTAFGRYLTKVDAYLANYHSFQVKFQWIDGALIEALERGYWVVLENANLCSASVLDRLNSLLEPNGSLIISEQHGLDGQPRLIRPHKDFRIFLTMDPRHGELSPAMRNRSLEIYMQSSQPETSHSQALVYTGVSAISRIRLLLGGDLRGVASELRMQIIRIRLNHLSVQEHMASDRWLPCLSCLLSPEDLEQITYYQRLPKELLRKILQFYTPLGSTSALDKDQAPHQPIRPIQNRQLISDANLNLALTLTWLMDTFITFFAVQRLLENATIRARNLPRSEMTILELSFQAEASSSSRLYKPHPVAAALKLLEHAIRGFLYQSLHLQSLCPLDASHSSQLRSQISNLEDWPSNVSTPIARHRTFLKIILDFFADLVHLTSHTHLDAGLFQVYLQIGQNIAAEMQYEVSELSQSLSNALGLLEQSSPIRYGHSLLRIWQSWRPITASNSEQFDQLDALEHVADQFDDLLLRVPNWAVSYAYVRVKLLLAWEDALRTGSDIIKLVHNLESIVEEMQSKLEISDSMPSRYFSSEFEYLSQLRDLYDDHTVQSFWGTGNRETLLLVKACRKTRLPEKSATPSLVPGLLSKIARFGGSESLDATRVWRGTSIIHLILKVNECEHQPLDSLTILSEDLKFMIGAVSSLSSVIVSNHAQRLKSDVALLLQQILILHEDYFEPGFEPLKAVSALNETSGLAFRKQIDDNHYFRVIISSFLKPAAIDLSQSGLDQEAQLKQAGWALFRVCTAILYLFVPDQPLDPALSLDAERHRYDRRLWELQTKLEAQKIFEKSFSGGTNSMDMEITANEISALGGKPPMSGVARPQVTKLPSLSAEFSNLISLVSKASDQILKQDAFQSQVGKDSSYARHREARLFQQNIARTVQRLSSCYREYADITVLVIRTLQCLNLGVDLIMSLDSPVSDVARLVEHLSMHTPFLGAKPLTLIRLGCLPTSLEKCSMAIRIKWLDHFALRYTASWEYQTDCEANQKLFVTIDQFYQEWKQRLTKEQQQEARKSRYYSYRGEDESDEVMMQTQMQELFPSFSDDTNTATDHATEFEYEPKTVAIALTKVLALVTSTNGQQSLEELVFTGLELVRRIAKENEVEFGPTTSAFTLPGALLLMHQRWERLDKTGASKASNIYTDADPAELQRISDLTRLIKHRIEEILVAWPEHGLLLEIRACCYEILRFKLSDPLAKILTKAEKLYQLTSEWQAIASREYSINSLVDQLTNVIVSWRKLELKSWSGLLDLEKEKCQNDTGSWFFAAYELLVAIPLKMIRAGEDVAPHIGDLVAALGSFLMETAYGQFSQRLKLIESLCCFISRFGQGSLAFLNLTSSITNLLQHYKRYEAAVEKSLHTESTKLVREIKEQVLTARWKDANVIALRDSANRSHYKLFKIIRKYRALLQQPIKENGAQVAVVESSGVAQPLREVRSWGIPQAAARALEVCRQELPGWRSRPTRFTDTLGAAASMRKLYHSTRAMINPHEEVNAMTSELSESIKDLRNLTPRKLNDDNKSLIQHLKTRKRRLLADVLKSLHHMGVRRNLNAKELFEQSSTARVLSTTPCILGSEVVVGINHANNEFHDFLDYIPKIRATLHEHSDELSGSDVTRCVGLAEGLLLLLRKQRASLSPILASLDRLHALSEMVAKLQRDKSSSITTATPLLSSGLRALMQQLHWLPNILGLGCKVLKVHAKHTEYEVTPVVDFMQSQSNSLRELYLKIHEASNFPTGLSTKSVRSMSQNAREMIIELRHNLLEFIERQPHIACHLQQVIWWTELQADDKSPRINETDPQPITHFDQKVCSTIDKVFVALQGMVEAGTSAMRSPKDAAWLTSSDSILVLMMKTLRVEKITVALENVVHGLHHINDLDIMTATSLLIVVTPIIEQYYYICCHTFQEYVSLHHQTCHFSNVLARAFLDISSKGFCSPLGESTEEKEQPGQIEPGTGLGDGEGEEDISKNIGEDEDLSELAQNPGRQSEQHEGSDIEDAIDMADAALEGAIDDSGHDQEQQEDRDGADEVEESGDPEEETGSVDDLDPSTVDEKLWNDLATGNDKELKSNNDNGLASKDEVTANESPSSREGGSIDDMDGQGGEGDERNLEQEDELLDLQEQNQLDALVQEEQVLGLPEDMQLDGDKDMKDDTISDDGLEEFSDMEDTEMPGLPPERPEELLEGDMEETPVEADTYTNPGEDFGARDEATGDGAEGQVDGESESQADVDGDGETQITGEDEGAKNAEDVIGEGSRLDGQANEDAPTQEQTSRRDRMHQAHTTEDRQPTEDAMAAGMDGTAQSAKSEIENRCSDMANDRQSEVFKKLGDILDRWHQRREVMRPSEHPQKPPTSADIEMKDADLEHVEDDADQGDTQALDAATKDQAKALDQSKALIEDQVDSNDNHQILDADEDGNDTQDHLPNTSPTDIDQQIEAQRDRSFQDPIGTEFDKSEVHIKERASSQAVDESHDIQDVDEQFSTLRHTSSSDAPLVSLEEASRLWTRYSSSVQSLSILVTEQLRLILAPTLATKLRGDFRTGKRLNIKRIIPYIASGYKKDKIWMRRSVPSKRNYQIMIAVDNSKSMMEGGAAALAMESLALMCKSLSMLEVGEICVVGFGDEDHVRIAHPFSQNFTGESGPRVFRHFNFQQTATDVRKLIMESIGLFRVARATSARANAELWQLELIISDGICEDHDTIRRLVRQAAEERMMMVFVIVDSANASGSSILDLQKVSYTSDGAGEEQRLTVKRYMDGFPFPYYVIVRDVRDLPSVLATALKGWFAQVVDVQG
jgi:midasin